MLRSFRYARLRRMENAINHYVWYLRQRGYKIVVGSRNDKDLLTEDSRDGYVHLRLEAADE